LGYIFITGSMSTTLTWLTPDATYSVK